MTINSEVRKAGPYIGGGLGVSALPFNFVIFSEHDVLVVRRNAFTGVETVLTRGIDYTVAVNPNQNASPGGTVTLTAPLQDTDTAVITSNIPALQQTDLTNQGGFYPAVITAALDKLTILIQQLQELSGRSLRLAISTPAGVNPSLPPPSSNAVIAWNAAGSSLENRTASDLASQIAYGSWKYVLFTGDGSTTSFDLPTDPASAANLDVSIDGSVKVPIDDWTLYGTRITFALAPASGSKIYVRYGDAVAESVRYETTQRFVAEEGQTVFLVSRPYAPGSGAMSVFVNGLRVEPGINYNETDETTVTFTSALSAGDFVTFVSYPITALITSSGGGGSGVEEDGGPKKIAVIGDSLTAQNAILGESPLGIMERTLNQMGAYVRVIGCGRDGHTFNRASTVPFIGGKTSVQYCIDNNPDVVIVALGLNDAANKVDGRTLAQVKADSDSLIATLRAALPAAKICYASEVPIDRANFTGATLKNKGALPYHFTLRTSGILAGFYSTEILDDACSTSTRNNISDWEALDAHIKANGMIDASFDMHAWKIARLGGVGNDGLHFNAGGYELAAGYLVKGMRGLTSVFPEVLTNNFDYWDDPDYLFSASLTASGDGWADTLPAVSENQSIISGNSRRQLTWYMPEDASILVTNTVGSSGFDTFSWSIKGAKKLTPVKISINNGAFITSSTITNSAGDARAFLPGIDLLATGLSAGSNIVRYAVGAVCLPPQSVNIVQNGAPVLWKKLTGTAPATTSGSVEISHGLTASKILKCSVLITDSIGQRIPPSSDAFAGYHYQVFVKPSTVFIQLISASSLTNRPVTVLLAYEP